MRAFRVVAFFDVENFLRFFLYARKLFSYITKVIFFWVRSRKKWLKYTAYFEKLVVKEILNQKNFTTVPF